MRALLLPSRACATVWTPEVAPMFTQKRDTLSTIGVARFFCSTVYWPNVFVKSRPTRPPCAAAAVTDTKPLPGRELHAAVSPDSKPSVNTTSVGPAHVGVNAALGTDSSPVPAAFSADTVK